MTQANLPSPDEIFDAEVVEPDEDDESENEEGASSEDILLMAPHPRRTEVMPI